MGLHSYPRSDESNALAVYCSASMFGEYCWTDLDVKVCYSDILAVSEKRSRVHLKQL